MAINRPNNRFFNRAWTLAPSGGRVPAGQRGKMLKLIT
jgi:hypothetical protein